MKKILISIIVLTSFMAKSQELTVYYKEKRKPAQVKKKESFDYTEIDSFLIEGMKKFRATHKPGVGKDSIQLYNQKFRAVSDSLYAIVKEKLKKKERNKAPLAIPSYDYITILKVNKKESLYYPQDNVSNDTVSRTSFNKKGKELVDEQINYNDSEIIYLDISQKKKISALKVHKFDFRGRKFLIDETLEPQEWELTEETKKIDQYRCYKAILKNSDKKVEAWYTNEIKAPYGPKGYYGLPGLILELKEGKKKVSFDKVSLFPSESIIINPPTEGEKINREELEGLAQKLFDQY
ncbi:GLPGLI family protein [uncultured Aquimarina sp.]|uniref:GLPGLI family protein n=1 Tax=uncultured Aquimarina sp. TaxID=575652 RepID=UPI00261B635A|nr:GLPGLI family protein [uncultured Aquimarina sp.]